MERLQELKNEVAAQEMRLKSLQLQHQQQCATTSNSSGSTERETLNALIFLKEKELALALMKVAELTGQLERLKRSEVKSESLPRAGKRSATSSVVPAVCNTSERCQQLDVRTGSHQAEDANANKTSTNADLMRPSRSFDASLLTPRRSASRDRFFSSLSNASYADPSSSFGSCSSSSSSNAIITSSSAPYVSSQTKPTPALNVSGDEKDLSAKLRHSTSSSIMSRFAPKPYSNRSMSVDCGVLRRPLLQNVQIHSQDDQIAAPVHNDTVPNSGPTSKTPKVCLLPKSASFHYGYNEKENALIKAKRSDSQYGNIKTSTTQNSLLPNHLPSSSVGFLKPKLTPKPVHLLKDCKPTSAAFIPLSKHNNNNNNINHSYPNNVSSFVESQKRRDKSSGVLTDALRDDLLNQPEDFYSNPTVSNTLTITLSQAANSRDPQLLDSTSERPLTSQNNVASSENTDKSYDSAEVFKKGGVRELSKMFSQLPKDSLVNAMNNKDATYRHTSGCIEKSDALKPSESSVPATIASRECLAAANEKGSGSTPGIDISANAVSSALSILLSSTSASNSSRHTTASRPNRLFGYSSSFSRPKFSFVPSDQKDSSSQQARDVEHIPTEDVPRAVVKAPTIYSLFSPPPKAKLSTGANASPEKYPRNTYDYNNSFNNSNTEPKTATKKNVYLPRLSYITLSSDLTRNPEENAIPKAKSRKRVTIDPSFLFISAVVEGELDIIKSVVAQVPNPDLSNDNGMTALHMAVCNDHIEVVKFLLDYGCNVNASNCESWTPLHYAALGNKKEITELLLSSGACVFALTASDHETPVQKCQSKTPCYEECIKVLDDFGNQLGSVNDGIVYSMADYEAECDNECSLKEGESIRVLRRGDEVESEWWWASKSSGSRSEEGYVPRSILSLHPRRPRMWRSK